MVKLPLRLIVFLPRNFFWGKINSQLIKHSLLSRPSTEREKIINSLTHAHKKKKKGEIEKKIDLREANNLREARL